MSKQELNIVHLYPEEMNIYGDLGNIITLKQRCQWRGIDVSIKTIDFTNTATGDIYFMGGGQDNDQFRVFGDLIKTKKKFLTEEVEANKVFLLICGAFQLFGEYFLDAQGREIKGLGILPVKTTAPGDALKDRCIGNILTTVTPDTEQKLKEYYPGEVANTFVGFENHGGQTFFQNETIAPLGKVVRGKGNNSTQGIEGARFKNVFCSYNHGSFLPKNPHFADLLIGLALEKKCGERVSLAPLDDEIEWNAHNIIMNFLRH